MKILITKTSDRNYSELKEYDSLERCVEECLNLNDDSNDIPEVVISRPKDYGNWYKGNTEILQCDYIVEIYDTWRE